MYNSFIEKQLQEKTRKESYVLQRMEAHRVLNLKRREKFLKKYEKRIQTFIYRMEEAPILHSASSDNKRFLYPFREESLNKQKQIRKGTNQETRKNNNKLKPNQKEQYPRYKLKTERGRVNNHHGLNNHSSLDINDTHFLKYNNNKKQNIIDNNENSFLAREKYEDHEKEIKKVYRNRVKEKEIHPKPMRFGIGEVRTSKKNIKKEEKESYQGQYYGEQKGAAQSMSDDSYSNSSKLWIKVLEIGNNLVQQSSVVTKQQKVLNPSKMELPFLKHSLILMRKEDNSSENVINKNDNQLRLKHYFKATMDILTQKKKLSRQARDILVNCNLMTVLDKKEETEKDYLQELHQIKTQQ